MNSALREFRVVVSPAGVFSDQIDPARLAAMLVPLSDFVFSKRAVAAFGELGAKTLGDLTAIHADDLLMVRGVGETTLSEVCEALHHYGLRFAR